MGQIEEGDYPSSINPIKLSQRIKNLQKILNEMQKRSNRLTDKKRQIVPKLIEQMTEANMNVHELRCQSGLKTSGIPENVVSDFYDEMIKMDNIKMKMKMGNNHQENE